MRALGARLPPQSYWYPDLWEGADRVAGQLRGDKECPFSGVTGKVWRKVPESAARSVQQTHSFESYFQDCGRKLLQITRQQAHRGVNSKMAVEHYYTSHHTKTDTQQGVLFPRRRSNIITNHTTTDSWESYLQDSCRPLLQITRQQTYIGLICKTAVKYHYKSHDNRHTARSLISKTVVKHYYKSHDNRHTARSLICKTAVKYHYKSHDNRHTARSLISKMMVEHYYKSHDKRHGHTICKFSAEIPFVEPQNDT